MSEPRSLSVEELFPPIGHRYVSDERLTELRDIAVSGDPMTLNGREVLELICDIRNAEQELNRFDALEHIGWTWPDAYYPTVVPFHFLPNDGGEPPMKPGIRRAYAFKVQTWAGGRAR